MDSNPAIRNNTRAGVSGARKITTTAMLCAVAYIAMLIGQLIPPVMFLSYDPKDVIVVIGGFIYGPVTALIVSAIVSLVEMFTVSSTGIYGCIMNIVSTCSFAVPAALVYKKYHTMKGAIAGLGVGILGVAAMMCLWNYIITPIYMGQPREVVAAMIPTLFLPFNLVKGTINAGITLLLYKPIVTALRKANLVEASTGGKGSGKMSTGVLLLGAALVITGTLLIMVLMGVL